MHKLFKLFLFTRGSINIAETRVMSIAVTTILVYEVSYETCVTGYTDKLLSGRVLNTIKQITTKKNTKLCEQLFSMQKVTKT